MFDNRKIKHLRKLPDGNNIVLIWVMLLTMAGRCNASGMIFLTENIPYTTKMLADELDFEENTVKLALEALEQLGMIIVDNGFFSIVGWGEHQNVDRLSEIREYNRLAKRKSREKQKLLTNVNDKSMTSQSCQETDIDKDIDIDKEERRIDYGGIVQMYNAHCPSLPSVKSISATRKKAIKARMNTYSVDDFEVLFQKAEASDFLKGKNSRNWTVTFDWLIKDANMAKVLDGNYDNKQDERNNIQPEEDDLAGIF